MCKSLNSFERGVSCHGVTVLGNLLKTIVTVHGGCVSPYPYRLRRPFNAGADQVKS